MFTYWIIFTAKPKSHSHVQTLMITYCRHFAWSDPSVVGFLFFCSNTGLTPGGYKTLRSMQANWNWSCVCVPVWESMWYKISETRGVQGKTYNNSTPSVKETSTQWHRENQTLCLRFKRCIRTLLFVIHLLIAFCFLTVQVFGWFFFLIHVGSPLFCWVLFLVKPQVNQRRVLKSQSLVGSSNSWVEKCVCVLVCTSSL